MLALEAGALAQADVGVDPVDAGAVVLTRTRLKFIKKICSQKYSGDLNTELVRYSNGQKEVGCQMVRY